MKLASKTLNIDDTAIHGGSNIFIPNESNLGLPDVLPDTFNSSDNLIDFDNYLKGGEIEVDDEFEYGGDNCRSKDKKKIIGGDSCGVDEHNFIGGDSCSSKDKKKIIGDDNYKTPTDTPLTIVELDDSEKTPNYTPITTTELSMEGGNNNMTSPSSSEIFESISKTE